MSIKKLFGLEVTVLDFDPRVLGAISNFPGVHTNFVWHCQVFLEASKKVHLNDGSKGFQNVCLIEKRTVSRASYGLSMTVK